MSVQTFGGVWQVSFKAYLWQCYHHSPLRAFYQHFIFPCYQDQKQSQGNNVQYSQVPSHFCLFACVILYMKVSPCSHWQYTMIHPPPPPPHGGLEISHFIFQGCRYLLEPQGQLFTLGSRVLIQGCNDLKWRMGDEEKTRERMISWTAEVQRECWESEGTRPTTTGNKCRTKREKEEEEEEEGKVSLDFHRPVRKAVIVREPHLGETDSPICLPNLFIRFCLSPFRDLKWQCTMDA